MSILETYTQSKMLSLRVVTILSLLFTIASLRPGKHFLIETDDATGDGQYRDFLLKLS